jgi:nicotinic acid mononucleotide adenylyltransferase
MREIHEEYLPIRSKDVLDKIHAGDPAWESMVPPKVAQLIRERHLFGWRPAADSAMVAAGQ